MDLSGFVVALLAVGLPLVAILVAAAWLAGRGVQRIRIATRDGRLLAELVLAPPGPPAARAEKPAPAAFRP